MIGDDLARTRRLYKVGCGEGAAGERMGGGVATFRLARAIGSIAIARVAK